MNEAAIDRTRPVAPGKQRSRAARWWKSSVTGYALLTVLVLAGYATRQWSPISPESGIGYWLGIIGGSLMLALLLYPLRKRFRIMQKMGATRHWFSVTPNARWKRSRIWIYWCASICLSPPPPGTPITSWR